MNPSQDMSILSLVLQASWVVQLVMLILVAGSVASWATIFRKAAALKRVRKLNEEFEEDFWSGNSLNDLYTRATQNAKTGGPMERIFASGMREYRKLRERQIHDGTTLLDGTRRAMRASFQREMDQVESGLSFLGTGWLGIALYRPVWHRLGVMHAFTGFASMEQLTLATVAPGIAEALVATAMGLFAAIPAVTAYNRYANHIDRVASAQETFVEEFSNILQRNINSPVQATASGH